MDWRARISESHRELVNPDWLAPDELDDAPAVVLCHDAAADPLFVYANNAAARLWERPVTQFLGWPSRLTAPPWARASRAAALAAQTVVHDYSGVRVATSGRLFTIEEAILWPVTDDSGVVVGQAATFTRWTPLPASADPGPADSGSQA